MSSTQAQPAPGELCCEDALIQLEGVAAAPLRRLRQTDISAPLRVVE
jgi:hypothetical protein